MAGNGRKQPATSKPTVLRRPKVARPLDAFHEFELMEILLIWICEFDIAHLSLPAGRALSRVN